MNINTIYLYILNKNGLFNMIEITKGYKVLDKDMKAIYGNK